MNTISKIVILMVLMSCNEINKTKHANIDLADTVVSQRNTDTHLRYHEANSITDISPRFDGRYKYSDSFSLLGKHLKDSITELDLIEQNMVRRHKELNTGGFKLIADYATNKTYTDYDSKKEDFYYYPVYLINQSPEIKILLMKSGIYGLQEALDTNGQWRPIEGRGPDFCGVGHTGLKVHPKQYVKLLFPKYTGNYKTKIRVRIKNGETLYISEPFDGIINYNQFNLDKLSSLYEFFVENKTEAIQSYFFGAIPLGTDDNNKIIKVRK